MKAERFAGWRFSIGLKTDRPVKPDRTGRRAAFVETPETGTLVRLKDFRLVKVRGDEAVDGTTPCSLTSEPAISGLERVKYTSYRRSSDNI